MSSNLKFKFNDLLWEIRFQYAPDKSFTDCYLCQIIESPMDPELKHRVDVHHGVAKTCDVDLKSFNKEVGRKLSLTRALQNCSTEFKRAAWNCYLTRLSFKNLTFKTKYAVTYYDDRPFSLFQNIKNMCYWLTWNTKNICKVLFS